MSVQVVWYDEHPGSTWKLAYDAGQPALKTALEVTGTGDKQWHHETVTLKDAVFGHGGARGSDLALINTDDKDDIFSLIEVRRGMPEGAPGLSREEADSRQEPAPTKTKHSKKKDQRE